MISSLLAGVAVFAASSSVQASACPCATPAPAAPCYKTITVTEWVPVSYQATRTVYKTEYVTEKYTAYKTICVPETRTASCTVNKMVPEIREEVRTCYKCVPVCETRTIMKKQVVCKQVTTVTRKCVDKGHYECCTVDAGPSCMDRLRKCCDPCYCPCPRTKTKKVWVSCKVWIETPCTKTVKEVVCVPETIQVTVNKMVPYQETYKVCTHRCVSEVVNHTYTVNVRKCVPYEATRCVARCVPVVETYTACKMVAQTVCKQVPVCEPTCVPCCKHRGWKCCR
jgi:hypothetical protein